MTVIKSSSPWRSYSSTLRSLLLLAMLTTTALAFSSSFSMQRQKHEKFTKIKPAFPLDIKPVEAGGWYNIEKASAQIDTAKEELVKLIMDGLQENSDKKIEQRKHAEQIEALAIILHTKSKGFNADLVNGEWNLVYSKQSSKSPKFQKLVSKTEKAGKTDNIFHVDTLTFEGTSRILKKGMLGSKVKYNPIGEGYTKSLDDKPKIIIRRISCDIIGGSWKFWFFPKIPLPLRVKGGYLDFYYMDEDIRITRGNRGGLFIHFRPTYLQEKLQ